MNQKPAEYQFWDTSAVVALIIEERHTPVSIKAKDQGKRFLAWDWLQMEAFSAIVRRGQGAQSFKLLRQLLERFEFISLDSRDHLAIGKVIAKHRLRSADAGHLFCLKQSKRLHSGISFVCFDDELTKAAEREGIRVFS